MMTVHPAIHLATTMPGSAILIVDDSPTIRQILKTYLTGRSFEFVEADNGERALQLAKLMPVELVIADVRMPGMDGLELTRAIRGSETPRVRELPVILLTGDKSEEMKAEGLAAGATAFVQKPVSSENLKRIVNELLPQRPTA
jgi:two-component system, chemotaxis family, chemotaxis protein CheY